MKARRNRILVADCHEEILIAFERLLEDEGYDTMTAWTAHDALKALQQGSFDILLVNEYLPEMDAEDFISESRHCGALTPCIVMQPSAAQITDVARFVRAGAVAVVCKWSHDDVLAAVRTQLMSAHKRRVVA